ncbi:hypothetical protein UlMin_034428 [Ulmus minor]
MRLVPLYLSQLDTLFEIFYECTELNPKPIEEEEEHNWIFIADQLGDEAVAEVKDPYWNLSQNPTTMICHSNGDHDLAHTMLEYDCSSFPNAFSIYYDINLYTPLFCRDY